MNGHPFTVRANWHVWGALEALPVTLEGKPAPPGVVLAAVRTDTQAQVATGATDEFGYVIVTPVPANGSVQYRLEQV